jgi:hypothetical protein
MKTMQVICFVLAIAVVSGLTSAASSFAKNLELQNQNHVGHCIGAGNCRSGHSGTSQPVPQPGGDCGIGCGLRNLRSADARSASGNHLERSRAKR